MEEYRHKFEKSAGKKIGLAFCDLSGTPS